MQTKTFLGLSDDLVFKHVFSKADVLTSFLNAYFTFMNEDKQVLKVTSSIDHPIKGNKRKYKMYYGDVLAYLNTDEIISLEIYKEFYLKDYKKSLAYISRKYSNQFERGRNYKSGKKVTGINIILNNHLKSPKVLMNDYVFIDKFNYQNMNNKYLEMVLLNIDRVNKIVYDKNEEKLIKWLRLIGAESMEELREIAKGEMEMEQAIAYMEDFLNDEEIQDHYDKIVDVAENAEQKGLTKGLTKGRTEGKRLANMKIAKNMLKKKYPIQDIAELTNLTIEEIENIKTYKE